MRILIGLIASSLAAMCVSGIRTAEAAVLLKPEDVTLKPKEGLLLGRNIGKTKQNKKNWQNNLRLAEKRGNSRPLFRGK